MSKTKNKGVVVFCLIPAIALLLNSIYLFLTDVIVIGISQFYFMPIIQTWYSYLLYAILFFILAYFFNKQNKK